MLLYKHVGGVRIMKRIIKLVAAVCFSFSIIFSSLSADAIVLSSKEFSMYFYGKSSDGLLIGISEYIGKSKNVIVPSQYKNQKIYCIDSQAFSYKKMESVVIEEGIKVLGDKVFYKSYFLKKVVIPNSVTSIGKEMFSCCTRLEEVTIGNGITSIPINTFQNSAIRKITIPPTVTSISSYAFTNSQSITICGYSGSYAETFANNNGYAFETINNNDKYDKIESDTVDEESQKTEEEEITNVEINEENSNYEKSESVSAKVSQNFANSNTKEENKTTSDTASKSKEKTILKDESTKKISSDTQNSKDKPESFILKYKTSIIVLLIAVVVLVAVVILAILL